VSSSAKITVGGPPVEILAALAATSWPSGVLRKSLIASMEGA